jgi:hypothetical protein
MRSMLRRRIMAVIAGLVLCASLLLPTEAVAHGNGRGRGQAKKSQKFINGHDARSGRWDGRGPRPRLALRPRRNGRHRGWVIGRHRRPHRVRAIRGR